MDAEVQAFLDKWAEKSAAKQESLVATGAAKLADWGAENALTPEEKQRHLDESAKQWHIVELRGKATGDEGRLYDEAVALADAYVDNHVQQFASFEQYVPDGHDTLVTIISALSKRELLEEATKLTMFELVRFERKHIGQAVNMSTRRTR